ncbi:MAG: pyruvate dehydrogenase complex dihydrolipoamide acetyltransferase [Alphaproteobacteria bacterium]
MPIKITMPALSPTMTEGNLARWLKKEGDAIKAGDVIAEIETDKATMEVEAVDEGILGKILVPAGTEKVPVNDVIGILLEEGESADSVILSGGRKPVVEGSSVSIPKKDPSITPELRSGSTRDDKMGGRVFASPLARRIAKEKNIDISKIQGSGPNGRIVRKDIEGKLASAPASSAPSSRPAASGVDARKQADLLGMAYTPLPNNQIKRVTAQRLQESKQLVPHFYLSVDCRLDALLEMRRQINDLANGAYKVSVNDFVIRAAAVALKAYPAANVSWTDDAVLQYTKADISVAVSTPNGLITPIVKAAEDKTLRQISEEVKDLAKRAREGKLKPQEFQGGSFTVSNLGMFGVKSFGAIINPPQSCILAVGAGEERPFVENGQIKIGNFMTCTLSVDHRSVDGTVGAEYLQHFKKFIENPAGLFI